MIERAYAAVEIKAEQVVDPGRGQVGIHDGHPVAEQGDLGGEVGGEVRLSGTPAIRVNCDDFGHSVMHCPLCQVARASREQAARSLGHRVREAYRGLPLAFPVPPGCTHLTL